MAHLENYVKVYLFDNEIMPIFETPSSVNHYV